MAEIEWISVQDRLPEKGGSYLVVGKSGGAYVTHFWEKSEYNKEAHFSSRYVTHWAVRPETPYRPKPEFVEVVHGRWVEENPKQSLYCRLIKCSNCGLTYTVNNEISLEDWAVDRNYCEKCGAKLDGKDGAENG